MHSMDGNLPDRQTDRYRIDTWAGTFALPLKLINT